MEEMQAVKAIEAILEQLPPALRARAMARVLGRAADGANQDATPWVRKSLDGWFGEAEDALYLAASMLDTVEEPSAEPTGRAARPPAVACEACGEEAPAGARSEGGKLIHVCSCCGADLFTGATR